MTVPDKPELHKWERPPSLLTKAPSKTKARNPLKCYQMKTPCELLGILT